MVLLWRCKRAEVTDEEYNKFYSELTREFDKPQRTITVSAEGSVTYKAPLRFPSCASVQLLHGGLRRRACSSTVRAFSSWIIATRSCPTICASCAAWSISPI